MQITHDWLVSVQTPRGAWTMAQLALLGVAWPPQHGWKRRLEGTEITEDIARRVEVAREQRRPRTIKRDRQRDRRERARTEQGSFT